MGLFDVLGVRHETAHTQILAWLLNPNEDHGLGTLVLREVCRGIPRLGSLDEVLVRSETTQEGSRPDITISTPRRYIMIENKIRDEAFKPQQLLAHVAGAAAKCSDSQRRFLLVLIPDEGRFGAPQLPKGLKCDRDIRDWRWVLRCLRSARANAPLSAQGRVFIPAYIEFIEREVLKMWKGFNTQTLNDKTAAAAATFLPRQSAVEAQLRELVEAMFAGLSLKRQSFSIRSEGTTDGQHTEGAPSLAGFRWHLNAKAGDALVLALYAKPNATAVTSLELWLELECGSARLLEHARGKKWTKKSVATDVFGPASWASFQEGNTWLYVATRIPRTLWLATTPRGARRAAEGVRGYVERHWDAYDAAMR